MAIEKLGYVPAYHDTETGEIVVDPNQVGEMDDDDDSGAVNWPFGRRARLARTQRMEDRLGRRVSRQQRRGLTQPDENEDVADAYEGAVARGAIIRNQYNGLGSVIIADTATGTLTDVINRTFWAKSLVLACGTPTDVLVLSITVAGLPINIGARGMPMTAWNHDSTRFTFEFSKKLAVTGQSFTVTLQNINGAGANRTIAGGLIGDELDPYAMQHMVEANLLASINR